MTMEGPREGGKKADVEKGEEESSERNRSDRSRSPARRTEESKTWSPQLPPLPARVPRPWDEVAEAMKKGFTEVDLGGQGGLRI